MTNFSSSAPSRSAACAICSLSSAALDLFSNSFNFRSLLRKEQTWTPRKPRAHASCAVSSRLDFPGRPDTRWMENSLLYSSHLPLRGPDTADCSGVILDRLWKRTGLIEHAPSRNRANDTLIAAERTPALQRFSTMASIARLVVSRLANGERKVEAVLTMMVLHWNSITLYEMTEHLCLRHEPDRHHWAVRLLLAQNNGLYKTTFSSISTTTIQQTALATVLAYSISRTLLPLSQTSSSPTLRTM